MCESYKRVNYERYEYLMNLIDELEGDAEEVRKLYNEFDDEAEAEKVYGEELDSIYREINRLEFEASTVM